MLSDESSFEYMSKWTALQDQRYCLFHALLNGLAHWKVLYKTQELLYYLPLVELRGGYCRSIRMLKFNTLNQVLTLEFNLFEKSDLGKLLIGLFMRKVFFNFTNSLQIQYYSLLQVPLSSWETYQVRILTNMVGFC